MRACVTIALACALVVAGACKRFGEGPSDQPSPVDPPRDAGPDASSDGGPLGDVRAYTVFDDFERPDPLKGSPFEWEMQGAIAKADCPAGPQCSPGTMLGLVVNAGGPRPLMTADLDADSRVVRLDFAMRTDAHGKVISHAQLASIALSESRNIYLEVREGRLRLGDQKKKPGGGNDYDNQEIDLAAHSDAWARYRIDADFDRSFARVWRNGVVLGEKELRQLITEAPFEAQKLRIGASYWDGLTAFDIYVDDIGKIDADDVQP